MRSKPADSRLLGRLAGAVADGEGVDWPAARREVEGTELERVVRGLQSLAERVSDVSSSSGAAHRPSDAQGSLPAWFLAYGVLVVVQLSFAATAFAHGLTLGVAQAVAGWTFAVAALLLVQRPPFETRAVALASVFLSVASAATEQLAVQESRSLGSWGAVLRCMPAPEILLPFFLWFFVRRFPHARHEGRADRLARRARLLAGAVAVVLWLAALAGVHGFARGTPMRVYWPLLFVLCAPAFLVMWARRREAALAERTRVAVFAAGLAIGIGPLILTVLAEAAVPAVARALDRPGVTASVGSVLYLLLLTVPLTTAYATRGSSLLSIPVLGRRAAQRALGRATLVSTVAVSAVLGSFQLAREGPRASVAVMALVAATGTCLLLLQRPVWRALGLRGKESWSDLIARLGYELSAQPALRAASVVEPLLSDLLHTEAALLARSSDGSFVAAHPRVPILDAAQALPLLLFQERTALAVSADLNGELYSCLPDADRQWIEAARAGVLVPVHGASAPAGVLVIGAQGGLDDQDLRGLEAVASALALALSTRAAAPNESTVADTAWECVLCGEVTATASPLCACGGALTPSAIPHELNGKFTLRRRIGRGGMGVVYLAVDQQLDREVALKTMPRVTAEAARQLRGEARAMAAVRHPHVAQIHGLETWSGVPVLILEYMSGGMLNSRLRQPLEPREAIDLAIALASGLEAVHAAGLLHRDVKPSNVGFDATGTPRLLDFGLSRLAAGADAALHASGHLTLAGLGAGTPLYMSPEVLAGAPPGPADDVWSLLVVLYECLAGAHPLRGAEREKLGRLPALGTLRPEIPATVAGFVDASLRARPETAAALRTGLAHLRAQAFGAPSGSVAGPAGGLSSSRARP